ncbi:two-partner secretion domain-containing protein [Carnimonas bestiolae]|uniref:two-partner secretion domain-containing protein n=1 Tax=Carnimonas bestiolae TaxID=3402172 RepID=UPI003EDB9342
MAYQPRLRRATALILLSTFLFQSIESAWASGVTAANGKTTVIHQNGSTVVNIAAPNKSGISHNQYKNFNVDKSGVTLNNQTKDGWGALSGDIKGNPNLKGKPAGLIINEVTSKSRSELKGTLDVAGNKAAVMIANPNGISCDGCQFTNMQGITLTTGKPTLDKDGALAALDVNGGKIVVGTNGLQGTFKANSGSALNYVEIIGHVAELRGRVEANQLKVTLGRNRIDYGNGAVSTKGAPNSEYKPPSVALDSKGIGGMYANSIRLIATEKGVGINSRELESRRGHITIESAGELKGASIKAKQDLNVRAPYVEGARSGSYQAGRDITVVTPSFANAGSWKAGNDFRLLANKVDNHEDGALLQANRNLTIQKNAVGHKSAEVKNRSGTIKTNAGDLVIRADTLTNKRSWYHTKTVDVKPDSQSVSVNDKSLSDHGINKWFGHVDLYNDGNFNVSRKYDRVTDAAAPGVISSGGNLYANTADITNDKSRISAAKNVYLAGQRYTGVSGQLAETNGYKLLTQGKNGQWSVRNYSIAKITGTDPATVTAGEDLVLDFSRNVTLRERNLPDAKEIHYNHPTESLKAKNILINSGYIDITTGVNASQTLKLLSSGKVYMKGAYLDVGKDLWLSSNDSIALKQSDLLANNIDLISRNDTISIEGWNNLFSDARESTLPLIYAKDALSVQAGKNIHVNDIGTTHSGELLLSAGGSINVSSSNDYLGKRPESQNRNLSLKQTSFDRRLQDANSFFTDRDITLLAGQNINITKARMNADQGKINLSAGQDITLPVLSLDPAFNKFFATSRAPELISTLNSKNGVTLLAGRDLLLPATKISSNKDINLMAGRDINLGAHVYRIVDGKNFDDKIVFADLHSGAGSISLAADRAIDLYGSELRANRDMHISSGGDTSLRSVPLYFYHLVHHGHTEGKTQKPSFLWSRNNVDILSLKSLLFQASSIRGKYGNLDAAAKGGFLFASAEEETSHYETKKRKKKGGLSGVFGGHKTEKHSHDDVHHRVAHFTAQNDINLLSRDDSTYEASKISAGKNAALTSEQGKVNFKAVKDSTFDQTISKSSGFYIKSTDKGFKEDVWRLPVIYTGGALTVDAAKGVTADIKRREGQSLDDAVNTLAKTSGLGWLKDINKRKDVQWNTVQDAYSNWHHTHKSLNPTVGAVIAIAVAAATSGAGIGAFGATTASGVALEGAATAGMAALTSQAAVAVVNNQGNLSKAFKELGSSHSVKSIIASMAINGSLSGLDAVAFGKAPTPNSGILPRLNDGQWNAVAGRVAAQTMFEASVNQAIYGGSFKDQLVDALLANSASQIQAQGAKIIGDNGDVLGAPGKAVSHAVLSGMTAEIGKGNKRGAIAGSLAAELAAITLGDNTIEAKDWAEQSERQAQLVRALGGVAGAVFTEDPSGAYSGATGGENTFRYNYLTHHQIELQEKELANASSMWDRQIIRMKWGLQDGKQDGALAAGFIAGIPANMADMGMSILDTAANPLQLFGNLTELVKNNAWGELADNVKQDYINRINSIKENYEKAGVSGAYTSGLETGKIATDIALIFLPLGGVARYGVKGVELISSIKKTPTMQQKIVESVGVIDSSKFSYVDDLPFNPYGSLGAAKPWSIKARLKYAQLPTVGKIRFVPEEKYHPSSPLLRGKNNGYFDRFGNEWTKGPSRTAGQAFEWDVQLSPRGQSMLGHLSRDGKHINVSLDGRITHK